MRNKAHQRIGMDWKLVKISRGPLRDQIYARNPQTGELVRVTDRMVQDEAIELIKKIGPHN